MIEELYNITAFRQPAWFLLALLPPVYYLLAHRFNISTLPSKYFEPEMKAWYIVNTSTRNNSKYVVYLFDWVLWILLAIILSGPHYKEYLPEDTLVKSGSVTIIAIDNSASMNIKDVGNISRLSRAIIEARIIVNRAPKHQAFGIVLFSGNSHLLNYPTADKSALNFYLDMIKPEMLPYAGSDIKQLLSYLSNIQSIVKKNVMRSAIIFSDGDFSDLKEENARPIEIKGITKIHTFSIGSLTSSPVQSFRDDGKWQHNSGTPVFSSRNNIFLATLSQKTSGDFTVLDSMDTSASLISNLLSDNKTITQQDGVYINIVPVVSFFILLLLLLFFIRYLVINEE